MPGVTNGFPGVSRGMPGWNSRSARCNNNEGYSGPAAVSAVSFPYTAPAKPGLKARKKQIFYKVNIFSPGLVWQV